MKYVALTVKVLMGIDNHRKNTNVLPPHNMSDNVLFFTKALELNGDLNEIKLLNFGLSHTLFFPPI